MPPLETPRLRLARFALADADDLYRCITPAVTRFLAWDPPTPEAVTDEWIDAIFAPLPESEKWTPL